MYTIKDMMLTFVKATRYLVGDYCTSVPYCGSGFLQVGFNFEVACLLLVLQSYCGDKLSEL